MSRTLPSETRAGRRTIGVLLPDPEMGGGFAEGATTAIARFAGDLAPAASEEAAARLDVRHGPLDRPDPAWTDLLCHGVEWVPWLREHAVARSARVVLTDRVPVGGAGDPLEGVTMVDWRWDQAAYLAGAAATRLALDAPAPGTPIGLIAGPPVPTQRRIAAAFAAGAHDSGHRGEIAVVHATSFDDSEDGERLGRLLREAAGCSVVAHSADATGEAGCRRAHEYGAATIGFLEPLGTHAALIDSDVTGVVGHLLALLAAGVELPGVYDAGLVSGHLDLLVAAPTLREAVDHHRPIATTVGIAEFSHEGAAA